MLNALRWIRNTLVKCLEWLVIFCMGVLTLDVLWQVISRYVLTKPAGWTDELATILLVWVAMLGASVAFAEKSHLGVDYFVEKLGPRWRAIADIVIHLFVVFFAGGIMMWGGWRIVALPFKVNQTTTSLGINYGFVYMAIPLSGCFILLFAIETIVEKCIFIKRGGGVPEKDRA